MTPANEMIDPDIERGSNDDDDSNANNAGLYASSWNAFEDNTKGDMHALKDPLLLPTNEEDIEDVVDVTRPKPRRSRTKVFLISLLAVAAALGVLSTIGLTVVAPKVVQTTIDGTKITFGANNITDVAEDGSTFLLTADMVIACDGALPATLRETELTFSYQGVDVGKASIPEMSFESHAPARNMTISTIFTMHDKRLEGWNNFAYDLLRNDVVTWHISGKPVVHVNLMGDWWMDFNADMEKDIDMLGLSGLSQLDIVDFDVDTPEDSPHPYFEIDAIMHNPSMSSVTPLGLISLEIFLESTGTRLGFIQAENFSMKPGPNPVHLSCPIIPDNLDDVNLAMADYFVGKPVNVIARMNDIVIDENTADPKYYPATDNPLMEEAMKLLEVPSSLTQPHMNFAKWALSHGNILQIIADLTLGKEVKTTCDIAFHNPLTATITASYLQMHVIYDSFAFSHIDTSISTVLTSHSVVPGEAIELDYYHSKDGEVALMEELAADASSLVPKGDTPADHKCNALDEIDGKCELKGYVCLGCDGNMTVNVGDLELTLSYWQAENFPVCTPGLGTDQSACQWRELGRPNPCQNNTKGRQYDE
ncbi:hypothetical protein TL16_g11977 [Triparma laevis f. inornata]|uniref:Uncharacterized protein n=1 Tax=Triparma laevis f. inornata TaxID=1714386 RepID=A0A9W7EUJ5_9STRA|nr:hypothetical protein TL16_g11977 [Triparma laevis f. inornata]